MLLSTPGSALLYIRPMLVCRLALYVVVAEIPPGEREGSRGLHEQMKTHTKNFYPYESQRSKKPKISKSKFKLKRYGVHSTPLQWISSYILNVEHLFSWSQVQSASLNLNSVPQGSLLGPPLVLIHRNGIVNSSNVLSFVLFADGTSQIKNLK